MSNATAAVFLCNTYNGLEWYCYFVIALCFLSLLLGFLGNMFTILYYMCIVKSWTSSTIFLFNLAVCDFAWMLIIPFSVYYRLHKRAVFATQLFCQFKRIFFDINIYGSIYFLTLISFDRYVGAVHPISSLKWWNKQKALYCTIVIWILIFLESTPDFYYTFAVQRQKDKAVCLDNIGESLYYVVPFTISRVLFGFLVPITVSFTCYILTLKALQRRKNCQQRRSRFAKPLSLILAAMVVFTVAFVPYHAMIMTVLMYRLSHQLNSDNIEQIFAVYKLTEITCSISCCLDPFIFMLASKKFQETYRAFRCPLKHRCNCCQSHRVGDIAIVL